MALRVNLLILCIVLLVITESQSQFRLPTTILPTNYRLELHPNIPDSNFEGTEYIQIRITDDYFNDTELNLTEISFNYYPGMTISVAELQITGPNDNNLSYIELDLDSNTQIATASFPILIEDLEAIVNTNNFTLYMQYTGQIRGGNDLAGWYKSIYFYNETNTTVENLVTQFQATDARSAFPCFDEPAFKATFDITFIAPIDAVKLSNMPKEDIEDLEQNDCPWTSPTGEYKTQCQRVIFEQTPIMSTYLLAFVIGGYLQVNDSTADPPQSVYYPYTFKEEEGRADFALDQSVQVLEEFGGERGFKISYNISGIDKLDSIGVSDFAAGAMENWGLVVYRTVRLLVDEEISSQASKSQQILIIAHELAHQWFGNLVTPDWWDDLWLNEGFATYMAYYGGNIIQPGYNLNELKLQAISNVMIDDSSIYTHSVKQEVEGDPTQILASFSSITYQKGMGVINTIANYMGNQEFLEGISEYLNEYKFDTATSEDLGVVLDAKYGNDTTISDIMSSFITQEGFPLIVIKTEEDTDNNNLVFTIEQKRFVKQGPAFYNRSIPWVSDDTVTSFQNQLWKIPMVWKDAEGSNIPVSNNLMTEREITFTNARPADPNSPEFYLVNPIDRDPQRQPEGLYNFFRVDYDDFSLQLLMDNWGGRIIGAADQFAIISDRYALMIASYITPESYLDFIRDIIPKMLNNLEKGRDVPNYPIFNVIIQSLIVIDDIFCERVFEEGGNTADDRALRGYFREFAQDLLRDVLEFVVDDINDPFSSFEDNPDEEDKHICVENSDCNILQSALLNALIRFNDRDIILHAYEIFNDCDNQVCEDPDLCQGCTGPEIQGERIQFVSEDVLQAMFAGVLSYDTGNADDLNNILAIYNQLNIEQQTYILNALNAVYPNEDLVQQALDFIMSDDVRGNMKVNALVAMKVCTAREPLWQFMTTTNEDGETPFDELFSGSGLFSQEPLTALANAFASTEKREAVSDFFAENDDRTVPGTERVLNQTLENIYSRYLWKEESQSGMETYMRTYIVNKYEDDFEIWQIILVTIFCCAGLILLVIAFWAISRPTDSDRIIYYMSMKREKKKRRRSSQGAGTALTSSLGHSLDRSLRTNSQNKQLSDNVDLAETTPGLNSNNDIVEDDGTNEQQSNGGGYGSTQAFNYQRLKEDDEQTS